MTEYERYLTGDLPVEVQQDLESEIRQEFGFVGDGGQTTKMVDIVRKLQLRLFQHYEQSRRTTA